MIAQQKRLETTFGPIIAKEGLQDWAHQNRLDTFGVTLANEALQDGSRFFQIQTLKIRTGQSGRDPTKVVRHFCPDFSK